MNIQLSDHFNYKKLLKFCFPSIMMMIFTSIYGVVDGLFVSNFAGKIAFASINLILPFTMIMGGLGFMFGTGGSAYVSKTLGEGKNKDANRYFSMIIYTTIISGIALSVIGIIFLPQISHLLGATDSMIEDCILYGKTLLIFNTAFMLQNVFQAFFVTSGKANYGLFITILAGVTNMVLDAVFIGFFKLGVVGAALATGIAQSVGGILPLIYFIRENNSLLQIVKTSLNPKVLLNTCTNGSSELMTNISTSVVSVVYNLQLLKYVGENGVATYGVLMYVQYIFISIFFGYGLGIVPIIGYNYGSGNNSELKNILVKSLKLMAISGITAMLIAQFSAELLAKIFVGYDIDLYNLTVHAFRIFSLSFVLAGLNIFCSSFFTALNNGLISATISFLRTLLFQMLCVLILPILFGLNGIWSAITVAEVLAFSISIIFLIKNKNEYHYF